MSISTLCEHCREPVTSADTYGVIAKGVEPRLMHVKCFVEYHQSLGFWERWRFGKIIYKRLSKKDLKNQLLMFASVGVLLSAYVVLSAYIEFGGDLSLLLVGVILLVMLVISAVGLFFFWLIIRNKARKQNRKWDLAEEAIKASYRSEYE